MAEAIAFVLKNLPGFFLLLALLGGAMTARGRPVAEHALGWLLLLPIGATGIWAGLFHALAPARSAALIGWEVSPFQWEVGMADLAIGVTAIAAFWASLPFKAAAVLSASVFLLGDAAGHVRQMIVAGNFAPGNAGLPFVMDVFCPLLAIGLLVAAYRASASRRDGPARF